MKMQASKSPALNLRAGLFHVDDEYFYAGVASKCQIDPAVDGNPLQGVDQLIADTVGRESRYFQMN